ncbi:unnamed protein product [Rodentolepis nana]|uniref:F-box domain-containing protein n=1 Tax=Rodentolepis nana TaxID=102285 RepID=A0A0R3T9M0_RODNA|nr:unnamed protein product [Rodentolepis nana]
MNNFNVLPCEILGEIFDYLSDVDFVNLCVTLENNVKFTKRCAVTGKLQELLHKIEWIDDYLRILIPRNLEEAPFSRLVKAIQYYQKQWKRCSQYSPVFRSPRSKNISIFVALSPIAENFFTDTLLSLKDETGMNIFDYKPTLDGVISGHLFSFNVSFHICTNDHNANVNEHYDGLIYEICLEKLADYWQDPSSWRRPDTIIKRCNLPALLFLDEYKTAMTSACENSLMQIQGRNFHYLRSVYRIMLDISIRDEPAATFPYENCRLWHFLRVGPHYKNLLIALRFLFMKIYQLRH